MGRRDSGVVLGIALGMVARTGNPLAPAAKAYGGSLLVFVSTQESCPFSRGLVSTEGIALGFVLI